MANSRNAKKRVRQNERRETLNRSRRSRMRQYLRKVEEAISSGDKASAEAAFKAAMPEVHRGAQRGVMHRNTMSRRLSGLSRRINAM